MLLGQHTLWEVDPDGVTDTLSCGHCLFSVRPGNGLPVSGVAPFNRIPVHHRDISRPKAHTDALGNPQQEFRQIMGLGERNGMQSQ